MHQSTADKSMLGDFRGTKSAAGFVLTGILRLSDCRKGVCRWAKIRCIAAFFADLI